MLAHYHGQVDASPTAVNRYRDVLASTFMIRVLPPWFELLPCHPVVGFILRMP